MFVAGRMFLGFSVVYDFAASSGTIGNSVEMSVLLHPNELCFPPAVVLPPLPSGYWAQGLRKERA